MTNPTYVAWAEYTDSDNKITGIISRVYLNAKTPVEAAIRLVQFTGLPPRELKFTVAQLDEKGECTAVYDNACLRSTQVIEHEAHQD